MTPEDRETARVNAAYTAKRRAERAAAEQRMKNARALLGRLAGPVGVTPAERDARRLTFNISAIKHLHGVDASNDPELRALIIADLATTTAKESRASNTRLMDLVAGRKRAQARLVGVRIIIIAVAVLVAGLLLFGVVL